MDQPETTPDIDPTFFHDPGPAIQEAAEQHLERVWEAFHREEEGELPDGQDVPSPAVAPFCGCSRCEIREVLAGAWPLIERYFAPQKAPRSTATG
jgi:hypothetical protein